MKDFIKKEKFYLLLIIFIILFSFLTVIVAFDYSDNIDENVSRHISGEPGNPLFEIMRYITHLGDFYFILPASIAVIVLFYYLKEPILSVLFAIMMLCAIPAYKVIKHLFKRQRPVINFINETGYSYPSGHTTGAFTFFIGLYVFYQLLYKNQHNYLFLTICGSLAFLVGLSRMVLGVHYLSDVIGGILLSGILVSSFTIIHERLGSKLKIHD
ncbi:MAG: phosphatase PAP2 family protein [Thermoplasmata archaeon]